MTGHNQQPFGSGALSAALVIITPSSALEEIDSTTIEKAVLDSSCDVFVVHYYVPGDPRTVEQRNVLEKLNGHYGGKVSFLQLDVSKHRDVPLCAAIDRPLVVVYALTRANSDRNKITGFYAKDNPRGTSLSALLHRIGAAVTYAADRKEHPMEWSVNGSITLDDSGVANREVPFWNWVLRSEDILKSINAQNVEQ